MPYAAHSANQDVARVSAVLTWYETHARDLPWRRPGCSAWGVLVSEVMLQQTPVVRVLPAWERWMERWPTPADLAAASQADAVRAWERLGYPRRAKRLWECARALVDEHGGEVPAAADALLALPGVGEYTAAAVESFAFGRRAIVLDTNVRRVIGRAWSRAPLPGPSVTRTERYLAARIVPAEASDAARWAVASMELGALVCTGARLGARTARWRRRVRGSRRGFRAWQMRRAERRPGTAPTGRCGAASWRCFARPMAR